MMLRTLCALAVALAAFPALADPADDAPTATHDASTAKQIAAFLADSPAAAPSGTALRAADQRPARDGKPHGIVEVGVGTHGYRSVYVETQMPLGENGEIAIAIGESRGGPARIGRRPVPRLAEPPAPPEQAADPSVSR